MEQAVAEGAPIIPRKLCNKSALIRFSRQIRTIPWSRIYHWKIETSASISLFCFTLDARRRKFYDVPKFIIHDKGGVIPNGDVYGREYFNSDKIEGCVVFPRAAVVDLLRRRPFEVNTPKKSFGFCRRKNLFPVELLVPLRRGNLRSCR